MVRTSCRTGIELKPWIPEPIIFDEPDRSCAVGILLNAYASMPYEFTPAFLNTIADVTESGRCDRSKSQGIWMTWDMVREMESAGMTIGGHTVNHPVLSRMPCEEQWHEISGCTRRIAEELDEPMLYFSYPMGRPHAFNGETRDCLRRAGVRYAFTYYGGFRPFEEWDDYDIRARASREQHRL